MDVPAYRVVVGHSSRMDVLRDAEADLVLTSPPYFPAEIATELELPIEKQRDFAEVREAILAHAYALDSVFREIARIIRPGRAVVLQTKDIRYGGSLIGLADAHRKMMETLDFRLLAQVHWQRPFIPQDPLRRFKQRPMVGAFRPLPLEAFLVFSSKGELEVQTNPVDLSGTDREACASSVWRMPPSRESLAHPYPSPPTAVRRLISLYSNQGDLVVDPFLGHGTTVKIAIEMGRRAVGYDISPACVDATRQRIEASIKKASTASRRKPRGDPPNPPGSIFDGYARTRTRP